MKTIKSVIIFSEIIILLISGIVISYGQTRAIKGTIFNTETNERIKDIGVAVKGADITTSSNKDGYFKLNIPDSIVNVEFSKFAGMSLDEVRLVEIDVYNIFLHNSIHELFNTSLVELSQIKVVSASNIAEKLAEVPATMIVISKQDILQRGYNSVSEIFNDLPGMDISRHYGNQSVYNYWRGYRTAYSQPYIFMVDGMSCNDIFYNQPQIIDNIPLSNIEKIEIVYGPVSAVYGANAFMGVINVITKTNINFDGIVFDSKTSINANGAVIGDIYTHYQKKKFRTSLAFRFENSDFSDKLNLDEFYTSKNLLADTLLWGNLATSLNKDNKVLIPYSGKSLDFRFAYSNTEFGLQVNSIQSGYGMGVPFDKYIPSVLFDRNYYNTWINQEFYLGEKLTTKLTLRYITEVRQKGDWIEAYNYTNNSSEDLIIDTDTLNPEETTRVIRYSLWPLKNEKISFSQQFNFTLSEKFLFTSGLQYSQTYISKQEGVYGNLYTPNNVVENNPEFYPKNKDFGLRSTNRVIWKDYSIYSQLKYSIFNGHFINLGLRLDDNSVYGISKTVRGGYIINYNKLSLKALYGQAYQIPTPRTLYSSETILGSSSDLRPEISETLELITDYTSKTISSWISTYYINNENTIVFIGNRAKNLGQRKVLGVDGFLNVIIPFDPVRSLAIWGYYSMYVFAKENTFNANGVKTGTENIGDLSKYKVYFGATSNLTKKIVINLRGRYKSERKAVSTNITSNGEARIIDNYFTMDANLMYQNLFTDGFSIALKVENIFNTRYYHPGVNKADAGTNSGYWSNNVWQGSQGWDNSLLPQPHRNFMLSLLFSL